MKQQVLILTDKPERVEESRHLKKLLKAYQERPPRPGSVHIVTVRHDFWSRLLNDRGACNCNPDIDLAEVRR